MKTIEERFWSKVKLGQGCWEWTAFKNYGYGSFGMKNEKGENRVVNAHRVAWMLKFGPIPNGLFVCHRCDNRGCVKTEPDIKYPDGHLFLANHQQNMDDMTSKGRHGNTLKTHCKHGHEFTESNTFHINTGGRSCRKCMRIWNVKAKIVQKNKKHA